MLKKFWESKSLTSYIVLAAIAITGTCSFMIVLFKFYGLL